MSAAAESNTRNVLEKISEVVKQSADGDYIFRGEPKHYPKVSSSLYRQYPEVETEHFDIEVVQRELLQEAKRHADEPDDFEILTQLQHYGGDTNLIDFTADFLIALFFACDRHFDMDGRVILQRREPIEDQLKEPRHPRNRVISQRSIFIQPPKGFIEPDHVVLIPKDLKQPILNHLRKYHGLSNATIYNDLHGFITNQRNHKSAYREFYRGLTCQEKGNHDKATHHYTKAIELNPNLAAAYNNRGIAYGKRGELDRAIEDCTKAIQLNPNLAEAYSNRGTAYQNKGELGRAIEDYTKATELNPNLAEAYNSRGAAYQNKGDLGQAIEDYTKAIELNPNHAEAYNNRGVAYGNRGEFGPAIEDYNRAIELNPNYAEAYYNSGITLLSREEWDRAKSKLCTAENEGIDIIAAFQSEYKSVTDFESQHGVDVPKDITAMLTPREGASG